VLFLIGDRRRNLPPSLYRTAGAAGLQAQSFEVVGGTPRGSDSLVEWFVDNEGAFAPPDEADDPPTLTTLKALPIPAKWAGLFLPGVPIPRALSLGVALVGTLPREDMMLGHVLIVWLRIAATARANDEPVIQTQWVRMELEEEAVIEWYDTLVEAFAPFPAPPPSPTGVAAHPGFGLNTLEPPPVAPSGKRYLTMERHRIFKYCGIAQPWAGLTDEAIPPFFKGLVDYRSKKASDVRFYVEGFAEESMAGHGKYCFIYSAQLINDLRISTSMEGTRRMPMRAAPRASVCSPSPLFKT
jgi:hypothetical protein